MEEDLTEGKLFATFEKHGEFVDAQHYFLSLNIAATPAAEEDRDEATLLRKLCDILDEYQEQSYLLDPFLEQLVPPVVEHFKKHAKLAVAHRNGEVPPPRAGRVSLLLYQYVKCRGYKTIIRFFPHEIADLSIALDYMTLPGGPIHKPSLWTLRYVALLWLSLICMIPFDLVQFDEGGKEGQTANAIESVAKRYLGKAGLEREGAAMLLSRFFDRKDARSRFYAFLDWSNTLLQGPVDVFTTIGILQVLCEVAKSGPLEQIQAKLPQIFCVSHAIEQNNTLICNTVVRKFKTKLTSRVALRLLPAKQRFMQNKGRTLTGGDVYIGSESSEDEDIDVPEEVESVLEELFRALQDKDTIVRWSSAKGVARISARLPADFVDQVLDTIIGLFSIHSIAAASLYDMPAIAESTWHGACLACAEMARRGLVAPEKLPNLIDWLFKALYFDIRKGAHSIGSNVRDAAAYVLWALARAQDASALAPHADNLACRLVTVALYDREIHIRRAASAAFQEHVGRMGLFPHGIDVLRKTDFYAVSVRRNAFIIAARQVAEHLEYRTFLVNHILTVTLRHWDPSMRRLGAQSLKGICQIDLHVLGSEVARRAALLFESIDTTDIHGGLLALTELAAAYLAADECDQLEGQRKETFKYLSRIPQKVVQGPRNELITEAACYLIANSISLDEIELETNSSVPHWREAVEYGLRHRSMAVQEAAAAAMAAVSKLVDCSAIVKRLIREFTKGSPIVQQSLGRFLGALDYNAHPHGLRNAIQCLLGCVTLSSPTRMSNVEARRNCYLAIPQILSTVAPRLPEHLSSSVVCELFDALQKGLDDYTIDERGDVGSWIRIACVRGLASSAEILFSNASIIPQFDEYLPASKYHNAIGGILRQGVERLDNVRQEAGEHFLRLLLLPLPAVASPECWRIHGDSLMKQLFLSETETTGWNDGAWLFSRAVRLLEVEQYRASILIGLVLSIGSRTDSTQRPVASNLVDYARELPVTTSAARTYDLPSFIRDLVEHAKSNITSNTVVIPVLQTFHILLEADALDRVSSHPDSLESLRVLLALTTKNISRIKSVLRVQESMKIVVNLLALSTLFESAVPRLADFLTHPVPKIRTDTAEYLYLVLQSKDLGSTDEVEEVLLETEWSASDTVATEEAAKEIVELLQKQGED